MYIISILLIIIFILISIYICVAICNRTYSGGKKLQFKTLLNRYNTRNCHNTRNRNNTPNRHNMPNRNIIKEPIINNARRFHSIVKEGYITFSKNIYDKISMHKLNLNELDIGNKIKLAASKKQPFQKQSHKHWTEFESWDKLQKDSIAKKEYLDEKIKILEYPNLDWTNVLKEINPLLKESREYIGIINLDKKTNKLYVKKYEGSPTSAEDEDSETTFASIPSNLVNKYYNMVGLFMFHTHPEDLRGSPLPSSYDLSAALYFSSISRFAASVIISRYGVLMYGLSTNGYNFLTKSKDYNLAILNLSFDIISAHESIRSWTNWKLDDYIKFYERYKMFMYIFPTSSYIADGIKYTNEWDITSPISYDLILEHYDDINNYNK